MTTTAPAQQNTPAQQGLQTLPRYLPVLAAGMTSILMQITLLRKLLSLFSGNELDIGITLAVWLTAVGAGSFIGHRLRFAHAFGLSFLAIAVLVLPSLLFIGAIPSLFSLERGETIPLAITIIATVLTLLPPCLVLGAQFPLSVAHLGGNAAKAYGTEAAGAVMGGLLFTFLFSGRTDALTLVTAVSAANVLSGFFLVKRKSLFLFLAAPLATYMFAGWMHIAFLNEGMDIEKKIESRYGEITVLRDGGQANVYAAGKFRFSYPDPQTEELKAHLPLSLHTSPSSILVVGGSPAVLREYLKYPLTSLDFVEIDPAMINLALDLLSPADRERLRDKRLKIETEDARRFLQAHQSPAWDVIVLNLPEPSTANINRFYTVEFFRAARAALKKGGILCLDLPVSYGYISRRMQVANGSVYQSLRAVFSHVEVSSEEYGALYASDEPIDTTPETLARRFSDRHLDVSYFFPALFSDIFDPLKVTMVRTRLGSVAAVNSDRKPVAYLYNLMLWADVHGGKMLNYALELKGSPILALFIVAVLCPVALFWKTRNDWAAAYSLFTSGYAAMAMSVIILLAYQASYGYVYETVGLLTALFMAGSATGAALAVQRPEPLARLRLLETGSIVMLTGASLFFSHEALYYVLSFLCGVISGMQFVAATRYTEARCATTASGRLYATELFGSFLGAILIALFFVPLLGIRGAIWSLAALKGTSLALLMTVGHEKN